jgi:hypothetical protein
MKLYIYILMKLYIYILSRYIYSLFTFHRVLRYFCLGNEYSCQEIQHLSISRSKYAVCNNAKLLTKMTANNLRTQYRDKTFTSGCCAYFFLPNKAKGSLLTVIAVLFCFSRVRTRLTLENTFHYFLRFFIDISLVCTLTLKTLAPPETAAITKFQK